MNNVLLVSRHEILNTLKKRSFWFLTILFPGLIILMNVITQITTRSSLSESPEIVPQNQAEMQVIGFVDRSGVIQHLPPALPAGMVTEIENEAEALSLLQNGTISLYFLIPADFIETGKLVQVSDQVNPLTSTHDRLFQYLLYYNLTGDEMLAQRLIQPAVLNTVSLEPSTTDRANPAAEILPFITMFIFFLAISMSSSFMLQSVTREKENRTVEILLLSLNPRQLMLGKVLGFSIVAFVQIAIWLGAGVFAMERGRSMIEAMRGVQLPPGVLLWGLVYFLFGYLMYASIMAAIGALSPTMREGSQVTFLAILPLLLPMWMSNTFIFAPNGGVSIFLSLFPLTSPTSMMTRMVSTNVPVWQILLGLALLAAAAYFFVSLSARFFRADTLLSGASLNWKRLGREFRRAIRK